MSGARRCLKIFVSLMIVILSSALSLTAFAVNTATVPENYLNGIIIERTFAGDYIVNIKFRENTSKRYKLRSLGNNSYSLVLPGVKLNTSQEDIFCDSDCSGIKVVLSEKQDLIAPGNFYTKINFKTKDNTFIKIKALADKKSKPQVVLPKEKVSEVSVLSDNIPDWLWYIPVLLLSSICIWLMFFVKISEPKEENHVQNNNLDNYIPVTERNSFFKHITPPIKTFFCRFDNQKTDNQVFDDNQYNDFYGKQQKDNKKYSVEDVPSIPEEFTLNSKNIPVKPEIKNDPGDIFNPKVLTPQELAVQNSGPVSTTSDSELQGIILFPEHPEIKEEEQFKDTLREADDIIFAQKAEFFENISPVKDIPRIVKKEKIDFIEEPQDIDYGDLIACFSKVLKIAHKISDDDTSSPEVADAFAVDDNIGFCLVLYGQKISFVGYIREKIFIIKTFDKTNLNDSSLFMEFCTQTAEYRSYSVILDDYKALVKVSDTEISLIGEY